MKHKAKQTSTITAKVYKPLKKRYNPRSLAIGIEVEKEHTPNVKLASNIAKNHLDEDPKYYLKLKSMEKKQFSYC